MHRAIQLKVRGIQKHHDVQHIHLFINTQNTLYVLSEIVQAQLNANSYCRKTILFSLSRKYHKVSMNTENSSNIPPEIKCKSSDTILHQKHHSGINGLTTKKTQS